MTVGTWYSLAKVAASCVAATAFLFHFVVTCVYLAPLNPVRLHFSAPIQAYMGTFFQQNWHLFAPDPVSSNLSLLGKCRVAEQESSWLDITAATLAPVHANRLSPFSAHAHLQLNVLRMYTWGLPAAIDARILKSCAAFPSDGDERAIPGHCESLRERQGAARERAKVMIGRLLVDACRDAGWPNVEHVNARIALLIFPRFSKRHEPDSAGGVSFEELGWRSVTR